MGSTDNVGLAVGDTGIDREKRKKSEEEEERRRRMMIVVVIKHS